MLLLHVKNHQKPQDMYHIPQTHIMIHRWFIPILLFAFMISTHFCDMASLLCVILKTALSTFAIYVLFIAYDAYSAPFNDATMEEDLLTIKRVFPAEMLRAKEFTCCQDVEMYYENTTLRDYWLLELVVGPGLHTRLEAPLPTGIHGGLMRQPTFILQHIHEVGAKRVLEIGSGRGACTFFLAGMRPDIQFVGIDITKLHVDIATKQATHFNNVTFIHGNACNLPQFSEPFDIVFGVEALCHLDSEELRQKFLQCAKSLLTANGRLVIVDGFSTKDQTHSNSNHTRSCLDLAMNGFHIRELPKTKDWVRQGIEVGLNIYDYRDLTNEALPFWILGWRFARFLLNFKTLIRLYLQSSVARAQTAGNLLAVATIAHALREENEAQYGVLVLNCPTSIDSTNSRLT